MSKGIFYGIGVGPGDPELMTLKAVHLIRECDYLAVPGKVKEETTAYQIAQQVIEGLDEKPCLEIDIPMSKDPVLLAYSYSEGASRIAKILAQGKNVACLTLGDPTIYSTYSHLQKEVRQLGYETVTISGVTSITGVAARLGLSLGSKDEEIHIIPGECDAAQALALPGTKVFIKAASKITELKQALEHFDGDVWMVEKCGFPGEKLYHGVEDLPEEAEYFSIVIAVETPAEEDIEVLRI
ncbi:MAG: precorrin-2 C(20)-methyltransferase [Lachnospiraceae bacterium]|nr:precorrin-2 C(20)-methyltransferase [Lachnospiraceae bacterium]